MPYLYLWYLPIFLMIPYYNWGKGLINQLNFYSYELSKLSSFQYFFFLFLNSFLLFLQTLIPFAGLFKALPQFFFLFSDTAIHLLTKLHIGLDAIICIFFFFFFLFLTLKNNSCLCFSILISFSLEYLCFSHYHVHVLFLFFFPLFVFFYLQPKLVFLLFIFFFF